MTRFRAYDSDDDSDESASFPSHPLQEASSSPEIPRQPSPNVQSPKSTSLSSDQGSEDDEDMNESMHEEANPDISQVRDPSDDDDDAVPWPQQLNLEPQRIHVMQTSLFRVPESAAHPMTSPNVLKHPRAHDVPMAPLSVPVRSSFAKPRVKPPSRKYIRVASASSVTAAFEGVYLDAGLSLGRSFRVGWAPGGKFTHVGSLRGNVADGSGTNDTKISISTIKLTNTPGNQVDLLSHLLSKTFIPALEEDDDYPRVIPDTQLNFSSFTPLLDSADISQTASLMRLGKALFDPLNLGLEESVGPEIRDHVLSLRRTDALSSWLENVVAPYVEQDLSMTSMSDSARRAFLQLTGNQVRKATETLLTGGNLRLATLVSQIPADSEFRDDIDQQLRIWIEEKVDAHIPSEIKKIYSLAAGSLDRREGSSNKEGINVLEGLDWLRVFGLHLWFASPLETPLRQVFERCEEVFKGGDASIGLPTPWYLNLSDSGHSSSVDGLFALLKLGLVPSTTLETALSPLGFGPNPQDYKMPWLIYILLSRCMRLRDFNDRGLHTSADTQTSYSATAELLTTGYAAQLEQEGLIQEAIFVLLFLERKERMKTAIKELLMRSAPALDEWTVAGITGSLKIPREWIDEAKASYALYEGDIFKAYELCVAGDAHSMAHELAVSYLAPEAVLCNDIALLKNLFMVLDKNAVPEWSFGGQLYLDYAETIVKLPEILRCRDEALEAPELQSLNSRARKLIGVLPDLIRKQQGSDKVREAAVSTMLSALLDLLDSQGASELILLDIPPGLVDDATRLRHLHASAQSSLFKTIDVVA